jgi:hypothetical protein
MAASMRSFCGPHAAASTVLGTIPIFEVVVVFTCARKPQKSQITSAHVKLVRSCFNVLGRFEYGHEQYSVTRFSPNAPFWWFVIPFWR